MSVGKADEAPDFSPGTPGVPSQGGSKVGIGGPLTSKKITRSTEDEDHLHKKIPHPEPQAGGSRIGPLDMLPVEKASPKELSDGQLVQIKDFLNTTGKEFRMHENLVHSIKKMDSGSYAVLFCTSDGGFDDDTCESVNLSEEQLREVLDRASGKTVEAKPLPSTHTPRECASTLRGILESINAITVGQGRNLTLKEIEGFIKQLDSELEKVPKELQEVAGVKEMIEQASQTAVELTILSNTLKKHGLTHL